MTASNLSIDSLDIAIRTDEWTGVLPAFTNDKSTLGDLTWKCDASDAFMFSPDGKYLAVAFAENVVVYDAASGTIICALPQRNVTALSFSPLCTFVVTWHRRKDEKTNLNIWRISTGDLQTGYFQRDLDRDTWPTLHWSHNEKLLCKCVQNEVHFHDGLNPSNSVINKLHLPNVQQVSLGPGDDGPALAVCVAATSSKPAAVSLFKYPHLNPAEVIASKSMVKVDVANFQWSPDGKTLLALLTAEMSNSNYYGESRLFIFTTDGKYSKAVPLLKSGAVHDMQWSPSGKEFIAIAGKSPPRAALFDVKANLIHDFGDASRNTVIWSPHGRFFVLAGFGNMVGDMDFYDRPTLTKLGTNNAACSVGHTWSPDGQYFMATTCRPRLRVDNGLKIFRYTGEGPIIHKEYPIMYGAVWRPVPTGTFPDRPASPDALKRAHNKATERNNGSSTGDKPKGVYRPPRSTGLVSQMMRDVNLAPEAPPKTKQKNQNTYKPPGAGGVPVGMAPPGAALNSAKKSKSAKRREAQKRAQKKAQKESNDDSANGTITNKPEMATQETHQPISKMNAEDLKKEHRKWLKKMKRIEAANAALAKGEKLQPAQKTLLESSHTVKAKLDEIEAAQQAMKK